MVSQGGAAVVFTNAIGLGKRATSRLVLLRRAWSSPVVGTHRGCFGAGAFREAFGHEPPGRSPLHMPSEQQDGPHSLTEIEARVPIRSLVVIDAELCARCNASTSK